MNRRTALAAFGCVLASCGTGGDGSLEFDLPPERPPTSSSNPSETSVAATTADIESEPVGETPPPAPSVDEVDVGAPIEPEAVRFEVDTIAGFGVNGQPRNWGTDGTQVVPVLDELVHDLGATFFRLEIFRGQTNWERTNDDVDPANFDWSVYDEIFGAKDFSDLYDYIRALNERGIDSIELSAHGLLPDWMGGETIAPDQEAEFVETIVAFLLHATSRTQEPRPRFRWVSAWNEADLGPPEGIDIDIDTQVRILRLLDSEMDQHPELDDIELIAPESSLEGPASDLRDADPGVDRIVAYASHRYGGGQDSQGWQGANPPQLMTEFNDWDDFCYTPDFDNALNLADNLVTGLADGFTGALVWTEFDAPHSHSDDRWESFGLFASILDGDSDLCDRVGQPTDAELDRLEYEPKDTYYAFKHAAAYIRPGAVRVPIGLSDDDITAVAFENTDGSVVVFGTNRGDDAAYEFGFDQMSAPAALTILTTIDDDPYAASGSASVDDGIALVDLPASSVFTLVGPSR